MRDLPSGTVTFLFTDIEGSTRLLHELGDQYADVLAEHRRVLREAFARNGGVEVDTQGDAFFIAFSRAHEAVAAALEAQKALADGPVRVRMGIHTGEPMLTNEGYVGVDVHRAARIMAAGHGGQALVSETTAQLLGPAADLRDLGQHRLKDLTAPQRLYQLGDGAFPPLKSLYRTNLPLQPTPLIGRERELEEIDALLRSHRLVTLTGPGGSGKTRLGLQLAAEGAEQFPDGVYWVPLQALRDAALVERAIAASVGAENGVIEHVADKRLLVLLDNFEHVLAAAPAVAALLAGTPNSKVLVTSREPLHVEAERRYAVEPLPEVDATTLFVERARAVATAFQPTASVTEICRRLDGLPLAVELAAARVALLDPDDLLARLERRLPLLSSTTRVAPERQRTLRATIEWSYDLLAPGEQRTFDALSVFVGSFDLDDAETVCGADLDTTQSLLVKSLLRRWGSGRLGMLDTIREYAVERLDESPEAEQVRRRHADHFAAVAESANLNPGSLRHGGQRLDIANAAQHDIRAALRWAIANRELDLAFRVAIAMDQFWTANDPGEGTRWFAELFDHPEVATVPAATRGHALRAYGSYVYLAGEVEEADRLWGESLLLFDELGDAHGRAVLLHRLALSALLLGDVKRSRRLVEESHALHAQNDDRWEKVWGHAQTTATLGAIARELGETRRASELITESARMAREVHVPWWEGGMRSELAALALRDGRVDEAETHARASLQIADELRDRAGRVFALGLFALIAAERGQRDRAGRLWGAIEDEQAGAPLGGWRHHRATFEARIQELADDDFERGRDSGRASTLDEAVELALAT